MTDTATAPSERTDDRPAPGSTSPAVAPLSTTAWVPLFGTGMWLAPLWVVVLVGNGIALAAIARWGSIDQSLWMEAGAGWQRWPVGAAGYIVVAVFMPLFVTNGVTRRRLGQSAIVTMVVVAMTGAALITLGFILEGLVFEAEDWPQAVSDGGDTIDAIGLPTVFVAFALSLAAWFAAGWLVACGVHRYGWLGLVPGLIAGLTPVVVTELLVMNRIGSTEFDVLERLGTPSLWVGVPTALAVIAVAAFAADRVTKTIAVD